MGERLSFDLSVMFAKDRQTNTQTQPGAATGSLGGEEGIKNLGQYLTGDSGSIVLKRGDDALRRARDTNAQRAMIAKLSNGLLGIGDQVQEDLSELARVAENQREIRGSREIHGDAIGAERMFMKLQAALDEFTQIEANLAGLWRAREGQETLNDLGGTTRLAMGNFELAAGGIVGGRIAQKFGDAEDGGERIIQFVGHAGNHLAHGREPLALD